MGKKIGIESSHGFGDGLFCVPLTKAISERHQSKVTIAVQAQCADAFSNIPWVDEIIHIPEMNHGVNWFNKQNYASYQITSNINFFVFKNLDLNHSLIDTPLFTGRQLGLSDFDQRPMFFPTETELSKYLDFDSRPTIAIESFYKSGQSWANREAFNLIINKYKNSHRILWLSNDEVPDGCCDLSKYTRRETIMLLRLAEIFFSVGSGFFCASLALQSCFQPNKIVCLWIDDLYRYEKRLAELQWHNNIIWIHNQNELIAFVNS